jgi:23S rRNA G2445 N2-methylase RlmL
MIYHARSFRARARSAEGRVGPRLALPTRRADDSSDLEPCLDPTRERQIFFATCAPGLEALLHAELRELRMARVERQTGGVHFEGTLADAWRANLRLRTAVRVLWRLARFGARDADALYEGASAVDWSRFLGPEGRFRVDAHTNRSALDHSLFVEQRVKDAVADQFRARTGTRPSVDLAEPDLGIHVHLYEDRCTLLADTSGDSLHKRGWRRFQGQAPLAETLAAAMVLQSGWDRRAPLIDPFCGSGTILVEAALFAGGIAPGLFRARFGFERWPGHDDAAFAALKEATRAEGRLPAKLRLLGHDADARVIAGARENLEAAGVAEHVELARQSVEAFSPRPGWNATIVTNPPYGERIGDERELQEVYRRFGAILRERCVGYRVLVLSGNPRLARSLGLTPARVSAWKNGAIDCELLEFEIGGTPGRPEGRR